MAVSVRMDAVLETQLTLAAQRRGISKSQFIIDAVQDALGYNDPGDVLLQVRKEFAPLRAAESKAGGPLVPMNSHAQRVRAAIRAKHDAERAAAREAAKAEKKSAASSKPAGGRGRGQGRSA